MRSTITLTAFMSLLAFASPMAYSQTTASSPVPTPSIFSQLFPRYTGLNGYEDLALATDLVRSNKALEAAEQENATLTLKRHALEDRDVEQALQHLRAGLDKQILSPRDSNKLDENTTFPELAQFRRLARVLAMEAYVALSEGHVSKAITSMRDGLRLGYATQSDTLISGLVGVAIDAIALSTVARHYDQLSVRDCSQVIALAREWLALPNPAENVLASEHALNIRLLREVRSDVPRLQKMLNDGMDPNEPVASESQLAQKELTDYIADHPAAAASIIDQAIALSNAEFTTVLAELRKPVWERKSLPKHESRATMPNRLLSSFTADMDLIVDKYSIELARVHLLGVHAAIHRYKWEHSSLPGSLEELKMPDLIIDPYTGKPLVYKITGDTYELFSIGGPYRDANGQESATQRVAVYLPPKI